MYLPGGKYVTLAGNPSAAASIGVTTQDKPAAGADVPFTVETSEEANTAYYAAWFVAEEGGYFTSDEGYAQREDDKGEAYLELYIEAAYALPFTGGGGACAQAASGLFLTLAGACLLRKRCKNNIWFRHHRGGPPRQNSHL